MAPCLWLLLFLKACLYVSLCPLFVLCFLWQLLTLHLIINFSSVEKISIVQFIIIKDNHHHPSREQLLYQSATIQIPTPCPFNYGQDLRFKILPLHGTTSPQGCFHLQQAVCLAGSQPNRFLSKTSLSSGIFIPERLCYMKHRIDYYTRGDTYYTGLSFSEISE